VIAWTYLTFDITQSNLIRENQILTASLFDFQNTEIEATQTWMSISSYIKLVYYQYLFIKNTNLISITEFMKFEY